MNAGSLDNKEKSKLEKELETYNKYTLDVLFTIHNLHKVNNNYTLALEYAREHT